MPFGAALTAARSLQLSGEAEWQAWSKTGARPVDMPSTPHRTYAQSGWSGWGHWLGTGSIRGEPRVFMPFTEALVLVRELQLKCREEWRAWCKTSARPADIPARPQTVYQQQGWRGIKHWLGTHGASVRAVVETPPSAVTTLMDVAHQTRPASLATCAEDDHDEAADDQAGDCGADCDDADDDEALPMDAEADHEATTATAARSADAASKHTSASAARNTTLQRPGAPQKLKRSELCASPEEKALHKVERRRVRLALEQEFGACGAVRADIVAANSMDDLAAAVAAGAGMHVDDLLPRLGWIQPGDPMAELRHLAGLMDAVKGTVCVETHVIAQLGGAAPCWRRMRGHTRCPCPCPCFCSTSSSGATYRMQPKASACSNANVDG